MYLLLRVNKKIKIKENVVFVYVSLINIMFFVALNTVYASINVFFLWLLIVKKKKFHYLYWTKNTFLMFLMENLHKKGNWNADQME